MYRLDVRSGQWSRRQPGGPWVPCDAPCDAEYRRTGEPDAAEVYAAEMPDGTHYPVSVVHEEYNFPSDVGYGCALMHTLVIGGDWKAERYAVSDRYPGRDWKTVSRKEWKERYKELKGAEI